MLGVSENENGDMIWCLKLGILHDISWHGYLMCSFLGWNDITDHMTWVRGKLHPFRCHFVRILVMTNSLLLNMAIEIVDSPIDSMVDLSIAKCKTFTRGYLFFQTKPGKFTSNLVCLLGI